MYKCRSPTWWDELLIRLCAENRRLYSAMSKECKTIPNKYKGHLQPNLNNTMRCSLECPCKNSAAKLSARK
ncbi:hypothetical protein SISSUDRAFT_835131 [Sistotremastrum suecicum HHB10207 ss-3]|uniref:Uncharacterized protein n=1 Tax=Sistotremastrum suecicum HHB10207 ss-3 TaxID=1314776 RepID=A0A166CMA4_9AGAM|nr:hypothetical protein SISSUDRAFT_835131 [Sistotremastrum suecicum HHB10207 ss-3]